MENIVTPVFETPVVLWLVAIIAIVTGIYLLTHITVRYWGGNRVLYLLSGGNQVIGNLLAPMPGLASIGIGIWALGRALGFC